MQYFILGLVVSILGTLCYKAVDTSMIQATPMVLELGTTAVLMIPVIILTILILPKEKTA